MGKSIISADDKSKIEELYKTGVIVRDVVKRLGNKYREETIKKYIQRNLKHLKEIHEREKDRTKQILKKTAWECSQEISSLEFAKRNLSIYKSNKSGDLVINRDVAQTVTFDKPKRVERKLEFS